MTWWYRHYPALLRATGLVYLFIFLFTLAAGEWHAERYAKRHPEKGI